MDSVNIIQCEQMPDIPESLGRERRGYSMVAYKDAIYIFGGFTNVEKLNDLLCFDIRKQLWSEIFMSSGQLPLPRCQHSAIIYKTSMFIFGGYSAYENELYEYQFSTKVWHEWDLNGNLPKTRDAKPVGAVIHSDRLWTFFGINDNSALGIWSTSLIGRNHQWEEIEQNSYAPKMIYNNAIVVAGDYMYALGTNFRGNSLFRFNFNDRTWLFLCNMPMLIDDYHNHMLADENQLLFIFIHSGVYCFSLDTQNLSHILLPDLLILKNDAYVQQAALVDDAIYISAYPNQLFKIKLPPNYPECTLRNDFKKILESKVLCDVEFLIGPKEVKFLAHIPIVVARSNWLTNCIRREFQKGSIILTVKLLNAIPELFQKILNYIYTDEIDCKDLFLSLDLYKFAGEICLKRLQQLIINQLNDAYLKDFVNLSNVLDVLSKAHLVKLVSVKEFCLKFITNNSKNCEFVRKSKKIETLDNFTLLLEIFRRTKLLPLAHSWDLESWDEDRSWDSLSDASWNDLSDIPKNEPSIRELPQNQPAIHELPPSEPLEVDMKVFIDGAIGKEFSDLTLILDENRIPAHKCILLARCNYFEAMFRSFMPLDNTVQIQIGEITPSKEAFDSLLKYIYYGEIDLPLEHSSQLVAAPSFYGFTNNRLLEVFKTNLKEFGTTENIIKVLEAAEQAQEHEMQEYLENVIAKRNSYS